MAYAVLGTAAALTLAPALIFTYRGLYRLYRKCLRCRALRTLCQPKEHLRWP